MKMVRTINECRHKKSKKAELIIMCVEASVDFLRKDVWEWLVEPPLRGFIWVEGRKGGAQPDLGMHNLWGWGGQLRVFDMGMLSEKEYFSATWLLLIITYR